MTAIYIIVFILLLVQQKQQCKAADRDASDMAPLHLASGVAHMPRLGYGTAAIQGMTKDLVCASLQRGFRLYDTAQAREWYREDELGAALEECWFSKGGRADDLMVITSHFYLISIFSLFSLFPLQYVMIDRDQNPSALLRRG